MKHQKTLLSSAIFLALSSQAYSQETPQELNLTVVEAENESSVSHTTKEISADEINTKSLSNIEDTTRYIPGVQVNDAGNRFGDNGFNIRGLQGDAVSVTVDGISLGETLAPASFSAYGMYDSTRSQVELEHVKSIVITKGPSAVANGANALAGSVTYITNDAADFLNENGNDTTIRAKAGFDSRSDETMANLTFANRSGPIESLLQYTVRDGSETESHGSGEKIETAFNTEGEQISSASATEVADPFSVETKSLLAKLAVEISEGHKIGILYDSTDREVDGTPLSRQSTTYFDFVTNDENNKERYGVFYNWDNADLVIFDSLSVTYDSQELFTSGITGFGFSSLGQSYLRQENRSTTQNSDSLNIDFEKFIDGNITHTLTYGLKWEERDIENVNWDIRYNDLTAASGLRDGYPERDQAWVPVTETSVFNLYVIDEVQLTDQLQVSAGLRYDSTTYSPKVDDTFADSSGSSISDSEFTALASELSASYEFLPGHSFLASYNRGYKAPSAQQLYLDTNGADVLVDKNTNVEYTDLNTVANPDLEADQSSSFEIGYKLESDRASLTITAYKTKYDNLIQNASLSSPYSSPVTVDEFNLFTRQYEEVIYTEDEYTQPQNLGQIDVQGVEIDATYAITQNLYSRFTFATIDGEYKNSLAGFHDEGDTLETAAPDSGTLTLGYRASNNNWGVALHALWFDGIDEQLTVAEAEARGVEPGELSFISLNNGNGPAHYPDAYTVFDLTAFYDITDNVSLTLAAYNLTDEEYYRWEVLNSIRPGSGGFFGGISEDGYKRYSEPGRSVSLNLSVTF